MSDGGKGDGLVFADDAVVADAHDGHVFGYAQTGLKGGGKHLGGVGVVIGQDGERLFGRSQSLSDFLEKERPVVDFGRFEDFVQDPTLGTVPVLSRGTVPGKACIAQFVNV